MKVSYLIFLATNIWLAAVFIMNDDSIGAGIMTGIYLILLFFANHKEKRDQ